jgi:hypothetical protein
VALDGPLIRRIRLAKALKHHHIPSAYSGITSAMSQCPWLKVYKEKPTYEERRGKKVTKHHLIYPSNSKNQFTRSTYHSQYPKEEEL